MDVGMIVGNLVGIFDLDGTDNTRGMNINKIHNITHLSINKPVSQLLYQLISD